MIRFPHTIIAGADFSASILSSDTPSPIWTVTCLLRGPSIADLETVEDDASTFFVTVVGAATQDFLPGHYAFEFRATTTRSSIVLGHGRTEVIADLANAQAGYDPRSDAERALEAINAVIQQRASVDQLRYRINNRELWRSSISDLFKLKALYESTVRRERANARGDTRFGRSIKVVFG